MVHEQIDITARASGYCAAGYRFHLSSENSECFFFRLVYLQTDNNIILVLLYTEINIALLHPTMSRQVTVTRKAAEEKEIHQQGDIVLM